MLAPPPLPRTLEASLRDLSSTKAATRASAVKDLTRHAALSDDLRTRAIPLFERALRDESPAVRAAAAVALADVRGDEAVATLLAAVEDADGHVRQMAINALGEIGDRRAATRLRRALDDDRPEVRYQALIAFSKLGDDPDVTVALLKATGDDDPAIRYISLRVAEDRHLAAERAGQESTGAIELVGRAKQMLDDSANEVAVVAAIFLATRGEAAGRDLIGKVVRGTLKTPEAEDEQEAIELAGALAMREVVPDLERRAWGVRRLVANTCAWNAKIALARMGHERAIGEITRDLRSPKRDTLSAAIVAAGRALIHAARPIIEHLPTDAADPDLVAEALAKLL